MKQAVVLLSGGLDSATCLAYATSLGYECHTLSFDYGQKHRSELNAAKKIAKYFNAKSHKIFDLKSFGAFGHSALTDNAIHVPDHKAGTEIPTTYVPARNTVFLSIALGLAESLSANDIFIGVSEVDYSGYPDCRQTFVTAFEAMANLATKAGIEGQKLTIHTPLIDLDKAQTIALGKKHGVDYSMTVSCYRADEKGRACGSCDSCILRKKGFEALGQRDETVYVQCD